METLRGALTIVLICLFGGWTYEILALTAPIALYFFLKKKLKHPYPFRRALLLFVILQIGAIVIGAADVVHGLSHH